MLLIALNNFFNTSGVSAISLPTTDIMVWLSSISTVPNGSSSFTISVRCALLSMVTDTATSEVVIISIGVRYFSNTSNTLRKKPYASNMRLLFILIAIMLSLAATAFTPVLFASSAIMVPPDSGSIVLSSLTGTLDCCAGQIQVGCKILAPK